MIKNTPTKRMIEVFVYNISIRTTYFLSTPYQS